GSQATTDTSSSIALVTPTVDEPLTENVVPDYPFNGLVYQYPLLSTEQVYLGTDYRMLSLQLNQRVSYEYFADAVFVGDSLADGFRVYLKDMLPPTARYCTAKSMSPLSFLTSTWDLDKDGVATAPLDDIGRLPARKVYIELGINSLANNQSDDVILKYYGELIDQVRVRQPTALVYVQSVTPTTKKKAEEMPDKYARERIVGLNNQLAALAVQKGVVFVDLHEVLEDAEGYLNTELCWPKPDGFHMAPKGYEVWLDYLTTHTIPANDSPYI
ncbi:MAG: GDSL-type esterase/lipase family protein, partial [Oscillospiraceae bacterium]